MVKWAQLNPLNAADFEFDAAETPLGDWRATVGCGLVYLGVVFIFNDYMKGKPKYVLYRATQIHNLILTLWSLAMFLGVTYGAAMRTMNEGLFAIVCDNTSKPMTGVLAYWCYIYYLSKYYELLDTIFMIAKGKPLTVLHVWHHFIIGPMSWSWLYGNWTMHWYGAFVNTLIHVFMYFYYFARQTWDYNPWWKKYITTAQIAQFFSVFFNIWVFCYFHFQTMPVLQVMPGDVIPTLVFQRGCNSSTWVVLFSQFVNITFLGLFINFYLQTYTKSKGKGKKSKKTSKAD